jgi:hypothetical protein
LLSVHDIIGTGMVRTCCRGTITRVRRRVLCGRAGRVRVVTTSTCQRRRRITVLTNRHACLCAQTKARL